MLGAGERSGPITLRFFSQLPANQTTRTRVVNLAISFPRSGQATVNRDVTALGITAHLRLRVTVTTT